MADRSGYIGRAPSDSSIIVARQTNQPTSTTSTFVFNSGYDVGYLDIYVNGSKLINALDYTATDTRNVTLTTAAVNGDVIEFVAYKAFNLANVLSSAPPGNFTVDGSVTATSFIGDGSALSGIDATQIQTGNTSVQTIDTGSDGHVKINTEGSERLRITSNGNVGISTSNPQERLDVRGDILIRSSTPNFKLQSANGSNPYYLAANISDVVDGGVQIGKGSDLNTGTSLLTLLSNGNAGVGTNNPQAKLHVRGSLRVDGSSSTTFNNNYSKIYQNSSASVDYGLQLTHYQGDTGHSDASITIGGNGTAREDNIVFRRSNGSGGTTESMRIDENGNATFVGSVHIAEASTDTGGDINANADGLVVDNSGGNTGLTFKTPNTASSRICFGDPEDNNVGQILYNHSGNTLTFSTSGSESMRITSAGLVRVPDNGKFVAGVGDDLQIYHNGTDTFIDNNTNDLYIRNLGDDLYLRAADDIYIQSQNGEAGIYVYGNGQVELFHNNSKKLNTNQEGVDITGEVLCDGINIDGAYEQVAEAVSALDINLSTGNYFTKTINGNSTFTFSNPPASGTVGSFTLELTHTSGTVTWPSSVKFPADTAPTLTAGKTHLFVFVTDDGGSRYRGAALADYVN